MDDTSRDTSPGETSSRGSSGPLVPVTTNTNLKDIRTAIDANISPDGKRVAFVVWEWVPDRSKQYARIWTVNTGVRDVKDVKDVKDVRSEAQPFTRGPRADTCPRWSPDSQQLAFISRGEGEKDRPQLHVIPADGGEARQVCKMPNGVSDLSWSPDGKRIAFLSVDGEEPASDPFVFIPGQGRHRRLWTVRVDSDRPEPVTPDGLSIWQYSWSPDGKQFVVFFAHGPGLTDWFRGQIGVVKAHGGNIRQLGKLTRQASALTWSPDGSRIAYVSGEWSDPDRGGGDIYVLSLHDGVTHNLTPGISCSPGWCQWFPDGRKLLFVAWEGVAYKIGVVDETEGTITTLMSDINFGESFWPHLSTTANLQRFVFTSSDKHPPDVWIGEFTFEGDVKTTVNTTPAPSTNNTSWTPVGADLSRPAPIYRPPGQSPHHQVHTIRSRNRLTELNPLLQDTLELARTEQIRYESVDGWQIDALFTLPLRQKSGTPPPLIVNVHGGPTGAWTDDWDNYRSQMLAAAGFAVLRPNVRGSMGRGVVFADAVVGDMGGKDLQDILFGVDYLVEQGLVDGYRVGIMGWSYGGFMTAWAVTQTTRFKAAVMGAGICDFHGYHAQSNIPDWDMRYLSNKVISPSEHPEIYRERSPITYASRVQTPTLIVHGEKDDVVPLNQAHAFYRALCERSVPTELVIYPREGHGLREREHIRDYQERLLRWFEKYLSFFL